MTRFDHKWPPPVKKILKTRSSRVRFPLRNQDDESQNFFQKHFGNVPACSPAFPLHFFGKKLCEYKRVNQEKIPDLQTAMKRITYCSRPDFSPASRASSRGGASVFHAGVPAAPAAGIVPAAAGAVPAACRSGVS